ncbi:hypothetical protein EGW08_015548 [Elysia chlorotica]|uniref:Corticotropin-releasing factor domain-containing protein n=1 Tax=Elysia chlorotica TaxID=188477 RepID=A0A433T541_ELYCH|nr:hypothetical protein EGW08_015548 [Elysia chlorotica]
MDPMSSLPSIKAKLTIASLLLVTVMAVSCQPLSPFDQSALGDFNSAPSSSSSSSSDDALSESAGLRALTPREADILALAAILESRRSAAAAAASRRNTINKRGFDFGFAGIDNIDHILSTLNKERQDGRNDNLKRIKELMRTSG